MDIARAREDREAFWPAWLQIVPMRRAEIVQSMVELAEDIFLKPVRIGMPASTGETWYWSRSSRGRKLPRPT